jgi:hypothetical protein
MIGKTAMTMTHLPYALRGPLLAALVASAAPLAASAEPQSFESPDAAVDAVIAALDARDAEALLAVFGPENGDVIFTGDDASDREDWRTFLANYQTLHRIAEDGDRATLYVGRDQWPFPVELVSANGQWQFDAPAAAEEIRLRRIGQNELDVIDLMHGYVRAQALYRSQNPDGDGLPSFAAAILSSAGSHDGLYWPATPGEPESPIGDFMARAAADGYEADGADLEPDPYLGYYYRVLQKQGPNAGPPGRRAAGPETLSRPPSCRIRANRRVCSCRFYGRESVSGPAAHGSSYRPNASCHRVMTLRLVTAMYSAAPTTRPNALDCRPETHQRRRGARGNTLSPRKTGTNLGRRLPGCGNSEW